MAYVITELCVGTLDTSCAQACPVDCIHPGPGETGAERATILYDEGLDAAERLLGAYLAGASGG